MLLRQWFIVALAATSVMSGCASAGYSKSGDASFGPGYATSPMAPPRAESPMGMPSQAPTMADSMGSAEFESFSNDGDMRPVEEDRRVAQTSGGAPPPPPPPPRPSPSGAKPEAPPEGQVSVMQNPMLIYTAELTMAVFEVNGSLSKVEEIGKAVGGFLAKRDDTSITIRVPVAKFQEAVKSIEGVGDLLHRNVAVQDVTEEFRDLEIQLKNAKAIRDRLAELLAKATKVEESLLIERELGRVSRELERLQGRMKFLNDRAAFSTITVVFQPRASEEVGDRFRLPVPWLYDMGLGRLLSL